MPRRESTMYAKKQYELEDLKTKLLKVFHDGLCPDIKLKETVFYELGETKTALLMFEKWYYRPREGTYVTLVILLTEYRGYQGADLIATCGEKGLSNFWGVEDDLASFGVQAMKTLGFLSKDS